MISPKECAARFPRHVVKKFHGEVAWAGNGVCARCGINVLGDVAVAFNDSEVWQDTP